MPRFIFYPDGIQGVALLVLRLSLALAPFPILFGLDHLAPLSGIAAPLAAILALQLALGFGTRVASLALSCATFWGMAAGPVAPMLLLGALAGSGGALALFGPGAYSVDARLFGRRVIHFGG